MAWNNNPHIVTNGLTLALDAADKNSYSGTGNTWFSVSGNSLSSSLMSSPTFESGSFFDFQSNKYAYVAYTPLLALTTNLTCECWGYLPNWDVAGTRKLISKTETGGYCISLNDAIYDGNYGVAMRLAGSYRSASFARTQITPGWHHTAFTFDGQYVRLYFDGEQKDVYNHGSTTTIDYTVSNNLTIASEAASGSAASTAGDYWLGKVASIRIYNRVLSSSEVLQNFNAQRKRFGI